MQATIFYLLPLILGVIIALINTNSINDLTEKIEKWIRVKQVNTAKQQGWLGRFVLNPILFIVVKFSDWTDSFTHRGLKNGVRVTITLYLIALWFFLLYAFFMFAVIVIIVGIMIYVLFKIFFSSSNESNYNVNKRIFEETMDYVGNKGKKVYAGTNWFNEELKGRVDENGNIYKGINSFNEEKIGRIDENGNIYEGTNYFNEQKVGRIDENGNLHKGHNWFNENKIGRIDEEGNIHKGTNLFNEEKKGRTGE